MSLLRMLALSATLAIPAAAPVMAQGDAEAGKTTAGELCARCHDIGPDGPFKQHPPSFAAIAVFRSTEQIHARIAYPPLHVNMPSVEYVLAPDAIADLVAYIVSLEDK